MKVAVVFWSGTGNTEAMANAMVEGAKGAGAEVELFTADAFDGDKLAGFDGVLFGCPAMGCEVLEESEFDPMFTDLEAKLSGVPVGLFGSYGWGSGEWMEDWKNRCSNDGQQQLNHKCLAYQLPIYALPVPGQKPANQEDYYNT